MRLEELSKWAVALNSPSATSPYSKSSKKKPFQDLVEKFKQPSDNAKTYARDNAQELSAIRSVEELQIDYTRALSIKRGDLAIIQGEVFRCSPLAAHLSDIPLIVKRLDCVDRRTYDLKVYEVDTFSRFQGHPNIVALYSFWAEKPTNPYTYKTLALLMEEGILGDVTFCSAKPNSSFQSLVSSLPLRYCQGLDCHSQLQYYSRSCETQLPLFGCW